MMSDSGELAHRSIRSRDGGRTARLAESQKIRSGTISKDSHMTLTMQPDDDEDAAALSTTQQQASKQSPLDFVEWGPPPDMNQRELIFDSLNKIVTANPQKGAYNASKGGAGKGDSRGTYVFTWGAGYHGQLGRKFVRGQKKYSAIPMMVEMNNVIRQVTCGGLHTAVVTEEGKVFTWGDGRKGELGNVHDPSLKQTPRPVEMLDHVFITSIACGGSHTVAVSDSGQLYTWGWGRHGQLGHGERQNQKFPKKVDHPLAREIVQVACGSKHTMAVTRNGSVLAWGANRHGQCGLGDFEIRLEPNRIEALADTPMSYVSCGAIHSCLVSAAGDVFICGFGEYFTQSESQHFFPDPKRVELPEPIRQVSCGQAHVLALSVNNNVYAWGSGEYGQCGFGIKGNSATPRLVLDTRNIRQVAAGRYHSFALTDSGILYSWGCGENGQLGLNSDENILLPTVVTPILGTVVGQVSCGEHHTAILTSAPWTKLSADVHEWLHAAKVEHELKELYLKKKNRGLTHKDLAKLAIKKEEWRVENEARKKELEAEEKSYIDAEIGSVQFESELQAEVAAAFAKAERDRAERANPSAAAQSSSSSSGQVKKLNLPPVNDATTHREGSEEEEEKKADRSTVTRLPTLGKKKKEASSGSQTERGGSAAALAQTAPLDGAATVRVERYDATQRAAPSSYAAIPSARTSFLKETAQMIKRMTHVIHDKGEAQSARELNETLQQLFAYRKEYDALRNVSRALQKKANELKRELELIQEGNSSHQDSQQDTDVRLQNLNMQLSTVMIKIAETSENRRNYELNIAHLKEEDFEHFNQLKALRKQNTDTNLYVKKMEDLRATSLLEKAKSESELQAFKQEIGEYEQFIAEQIESFQGILEIVRVQNEKREQAKVAREEKATASVAQRVTQLNSEQLSAEKESGSLSNRLISLDLKCRHFEDSFQKISAATGLNHPDAIVNKFFFKGEIKEQLQSEIDDKQHTLELLRREEENLRADLDAAKLNFKEQTWRDVEQLSESTREVSTRSNKSQKEIERITQRLAFVQEGLLYLFRTIDQEAVIKSADGEQVSSSSSSDATMSSLESGRDLPGQEGNPVKGLWSPSQSTSLFNRLDASIDLLFAAIAHEQEHRHLLELSSQQRAAAQAVQKAGDRNSNQAKLFGFNIKHLRLLSQQNQMVAEHLQQADPNHQFSQDASSSSSS